MSEAISYDLKALPANLRAKIDASGECWVWTGSKTRDGYGIGRFNGANVGTHRTTYTLLVGPIPAGLHIDHLCRVRACCNPAHLEPVTQLENTQRIPRPPRAARSGEPMRNLRVVDKLWDAAMAKAKAEGRTLSDVIREALQNYVEEKSA
jgi:hypothetical protein